MSHCTLKIHSRPIPPSDQASVLVIDPHRATVSPSPTQTIMVDLCTKQPHHCCCAEPSSQTCEEHLKLKGVSVYLVCSSLPDCRRSSAMAINVHDATWLASLYGIKPFTIDQDLSSKGSLEAWSTRRKGWQQHYGGYYFEDDKEKHNQQAKYTTNAVCFWWGTMSNVQGQGG